MTPPIRSERVEQAHIVQLARTLGARVYVLGTVRRKGDYQGTMQTPGVPDLWMMWPACQRREPEGYDRLLSGCGLWWEVKRMGGTRSPAQRAFGAQCVSAGVRYGWGDLDAFMAWCEASGRLRRRGGP